MTESAADLKPMRVTKNRPVRQRIGLRDDEITSLCLNISDELEGRITIDKIEPRPNEVFLTLRDRRTKSTQKYSFPRDSEPIDIRLGIFSAVSSMMLADHSNRKRA